jgi:hypothetical protein
MRDGEWLLGYSPHDNYPGASLTFGRESSGIYCLTEPDVSFRARTASAWAATTSGTPL